MVSGPWVTFSYLGSFLVHLLSDIVLTKPSIFQFIKLAVHSFTPGFAQVLLRDHYFLSWGLTKCSPTGALRSFFYYLWEADIPLAPDTSTIVALITL